MSLEGTEPLTLQSGGETASHLSTYFTICS